MGEHISPPGQAQRSKLRNTIGSRLVPSFAKEGNVPSSTIIYAKRHLTDDGKPRTHVPSTFQRLRETQFGQFCLDRRGSRERLSLIASHTNRPKNESRGHTARAIDVT